MLKVTGDLRTLFTDCDGTINLASLKNCPILKEGTVIGMVTNYDKNEMIWEGLLYEPTPKIALNTGTHSFEIQAISL